MDSTRLCTAAGMGAAIGLFLGWASPALAQARVEAVSRTCAELQQLVARSGPVVIYTGPFLYDIYGTTCGLRQRAVPGYVTARDNPQCLVGYTCAPSTGGND
ncbi:hypothetical protein QNA08_13565 [Chelatococcus sp. SYSU_G07232]|uniref:Uncharacterized protein n=1 Tax=Chelatococcus albus TaxID=3047466 RepID=A0ABT7AIR1_9HYPH|nr:hypothetical protein [Chelatococcus sp. SYSU_G07232]MDJ1159263.1 hypothetical protein [Chelatococcus sp. SYSU_G07232]